MAKHLILGHEGEDIAARYLEEHGYTVLDRNWRSGHKELDLIVKKDSVLVFVEVKTRTSTDYGDPWSFVDDKKRTDMDVRFDIVSISIEDGDFKIEHIKEAFFPPLE